MDDLFKTVILLVIKAVVSYAIAGAYALLRMAIFGDNGRLPTIEILIVFVGSITLGCWIVNKLFGIKK